MRWPVQQPSWQLLDSVFVYNHAGDLLRSKFSLVHLALHLGWLLEIKAAVLTSSQLPSTSMHRLTGCFIFLSFIFAQFLNSSWQLGRLPKPVMVTGGS